MKIATIMRISSIAAAAAVVAVLLVMPAAQAAPRADGIVGETTANATHDDATNPRSPRAL